MDQRVPRASSAAPREQGALAQRNAATFAGNRARGNVALNVVYRAGRSRRHKVYEDGSLRARFPNGRDLEAVLLNTAGGIAGGDHFAVSVSVGERAALTITTAAAEKCYRSLGSDAVVDVNLTIGQGGALRWLPQETIAFNEARLQRSIDVELEDGASILLAEAVVFGRTAMGESLVSGLFVDRWRVRRNRKLIFADTVRLEGEIARKLDEPAAAGGACAVASVFMAPASEAATAAIRGSDSFAGELAISAWDGFALARLCAHDGDIIRRDLRLLLSILSKEPLPRLWLN